MPGRFGAYGAQQDRADRLDTAARADGLLHVQLVVVQQTEVKFPVRGESHAIAAAAVRLAHGADEADRAPSFGEPEVLGLVRRML